MWVRSLGGEDPLEEQMIAHSSILAWRIPWTEEPDRPQSIGSDWTSYRAPMHVNKHRLLYLVPSSSSKW